MRIIIGTATTLLLLVAFGACSASTNEFFSGDFESGDLREWDHSQAIPGRIAVVEDVVAEGDRAGRFEVKGGDEEPGTGSQRAEVVSGLEYEEGDVRYFRILARVESWDHDHWGMIWQLHDQSSGSPPLSLQQGVEGSAQTLWLGSGDASHLYWEAELPKEGEWFEVVVRVEFGGSGSVRVWLDGEPQETLTGEAVYDEIDTLGEGPGYDKLGVYRSSSAEETAVVYYDGYRVTDELFSDPLR